METAICDPSASFLLLVGLLALLFLVLGIVLEDEDGPSTCDNHPEQEMVAQQMQQLKQQAVNSNEQMVEQANDILARAMEEARLKNQKNERR